MSVPDKSDLEAKLKELECPFTWDINKCDIEDLDGIPEKLLDRVKFCPRRYHATYLNILSFVSHMKGNNEGALEYLSKAEATLTADKQVQTEFLVTYANFAWVHYHSGHLGDVETYLGKLEEICKGVSGGSQYSCNLPVIHASKSEARKSQELIEDALKLSPDVPQVMRYVAKYFRTQDSTEASLDVLEKALEQTPNSSFLHHQIGLCYKKQLINMLQPGSGSRVPATLKRAKAEQCIQCFRKAVGLKPSNIHARINLAEAYGENQQLNEAEKIFTELLQDESLRDPDKQHVHTSYGLFLFYKKKAEDRAVAQFKAAYRMKIQSYNRRQAGKRLEQIAERWRKNRRAAEASQILAFLELKTRILLKLKTSPLPLRGE
ncbi:hypothetical protein ANANG_G00049120 [Anguilla anguilla]|uniref:Uncharacterized protein n=1 Tax=Anguilla anguilla TaxID=7936 RepID=A0A9D3MV17_ANGAN|nr:hypothetical protein ANANG_G00049120 [Anguilla anguilla]